MTNSSVGDFLAQIALKPGHYGEDTRITFLHGGGVALVPVGPDGPDESRTVVLDPDQAQELAARIGLDPEVASKMVAETIMRDYYVENANGPLILIVYCFIFWVGALLGLGAGALIL